MQFQYHQTSWKKRKIRGGGDNTEHVQAGNQTGFLNIQTLKNQDHKNFGMVTFHLNVYSKNSAKYYTWNHNKLHHLELPPSQIFPLVM